MKELLKEYPNFYDGGKLYRPYMDYDLHKKSMKKLTNNQYFKFIGQDILRPFQSMIYKHGDTLTVLTFCNTVKPGHFNYETLRDIWLTNRDWRENVICRLLSLYSHIDFSFFPDEPTANSIKSHLIDCGIKPYYQQESIRV